MKGRIQLALRNLAMTEAFQRYRIYLHPDLDLYRSYPDDNAWFTINEMWFGASWEGHPYPFRITLGIHKESGVGQPLRLVATGEMGGPLQDSVWRGVWQSVGRSFEVPTAEWIDIEIGYRQGDRSSGRFYVAVGRRPGAAPTTLIDVHDWTYSPASREPVPMTHWQPLKFYTSDRIISHVTGRGGTAQLFFDDLEIRNRWPSERM